MNIAGRHGKCQNGDNCTGPGCRAHTGKTARKKNWLRPHPNKHEGTRGFTGSAKTGGKKK